MAIIIRGFHQFISLSKGSGLLWAFILHSTMFSLSFGLFKGKHSTQGKHIRLPTAQPNHIRYRFLGWILSDFGCFDMVGWIKLRAIVNKVIPVGRTGSVLNCDRHHVTKYLLWRAIGNMGSSSLLVIKVHGD